MLTNLSESVKDSFVTLPVFEDIVHGFLVDLLTGKFFDIEDHVEILVDCLSAFEFGTDISGHIVVSGVELWISSEVIFRAAETKNVMSIAGCFILIDMRFGVFKITSKNTFGLIFINELEALFSHYWLSNHLLSNFYPWGLIVETGHEWSTLDSVHVNDWVELFTRLIDFIIENGFGIFCLRTAMALFGDDDK